MKAKIDGKYRLRVVLEDYDTGKVLATDSVRIENTGGTYYETRKPIVEMLAYQAAHFVKGMVGYHLKDTS